MGIESASACNRQNNKELEERGEKRFGTLWPRMMSEVSHAQCPSRQRLRSNRLIGNLLPRWLRTSFIPWIVFAPLTEIDLVNTCSSWNVYDYAGIAAMASGYGDRVESVAADLGNHPVREQSRSEFSEDEMLVGAARNGDR